MTKLNWKLTIYNLNGIIMEITESGKDLFVYKYSRNIISILKDI